MMNAIDAITSEGSSFDNASASMCVRRKRRTCPQLFLSPSSEF